MSIAVVEDDLLATLRARAQAKVRTIDSLPGDWDDDMLRRMLALTPCILVAFAGGAPIAGTAPAIDARWLVYVATANASGQAARRRGDAQQAGAYELIEQVVVPALHCHTVPGVGTLTLGPIENLFSGTVERQGLAVYAVTFQMPMEFDVTPAAELLADFETFDAQYDIPPLEAGAEHTKWLAGDYGTSTPDAHDQVAVPQT